ncbi:hypothetical protein LIER_31459 [Lithospermum erythrorhizon]|uniref:Uncharacterized protein n=1 Tax=Lithospermum erythrorhizon TaxID=34254 RepID=A0AAV3RU82_LITER
MHKTERNQQPAEAQIVIIHKGEARKYQHQTGNMQIKASSEVTETKGTASHLNLQ